MVTFPENKHGLTGPLKCIGSTGIFFQVRPGVVLKAPVKILQDQVVRERPSVAHDYSVERRILEWLGEHPRIVRYLGWLDDFPTGLLLEEASNGSLQDYLDHNEKETIPMDIRKKWFQQTIESISYIHSRGVIHGDLRPENFLLTSSLDIRLCDFGKSNCEELQITTGGLPDSGFSNPKFPWDMDVQTDIFALGSVLYTILKGHWPYRAPGGRFDSLEEMEKYESYVDNQFKQDIFPAVDDLFGGKVILGCWQRKYANVNEILQDVESES
ncbi:kinase-like protein [Hypomontagnella monticulosa]|nr:kinase-like protein [Hypomontagnella monticulosa]